MDPGDTKEENESNYEFDSPGTWQELNWSGYVENVSTNSVGFKLTGAYDGSIIDEMTVYTRYTVVPEPSSGVLVFIG